MKIRMLLVASLSVGVLSSTIPAYGQMQVSADYLRSPYPALQLPFGSKELTLGGVDLAGQGFEFIFRYVLIDSNTMIFEGCTKGTKELPSGCLLCSLSLTDRRVSVIKRLPDGYNGTFAKMCIFYARGTDRSEEPKIKPWILLLYPKGDYGKVMAQYEIWIEILERGKDGQFHTSLNEQIGQNNEFYPFVREAPFRHVQFDTPDYVPARMDRVKILFLNLRYDTEADLVIWRRVAVSKRWKEPGLDDWNRSDEFEVVTLGPNGYLSPRMLTEAEFGWFKAIQEDKREQLWKSAFP